MSEVRWDVSVKEDGSRVWIHEYSGEDVYCPQCYGKMIAVRGEIVQHHYRHHSDSNCSGESAKHWSKKYEIADALDGLGEVKVEGKIGNFVADVLFEQKWAFEVVFSNPPSDDKMTELRESLIIFNFNDRNVWDEENHDPHLVQFSHIEPAPKDFSDIVKTFGKAIIANSDVDVCYVCREVKGGFSRIKSDGRCPSCDMDYYNKSQKISAKEEIERRKQEQEEGDRLYEQQRVVDIEIRRKKSQEEHEKDKAEKSKEHLTRERHYSQEGTYGSREHCEQGCKHCQSENKALDMVDEFCQNMKKSGIVDKTREMGTFNKILKSAEEKDQRVREFLKEPSSLSQFFKDFRSFLIEKDQFVSDVTQYCRGKCNHIGPRGGKCKNTVEDYSEFCYEHRGSQRV